MAARTTTARQIRAAIGTLDLNQVAANFDQDNAPPLLVCTDVSVDAFNQYVGDGEGLPITVRFLELRDDGTLCIIDLPSLVHESTTRKFEEVFTEAFGSPHELKKSGSGTTHRAGWPNKEADATYGPCAFTPHHNSAPAGLDMALWYTLVAEVGRLQSWASLDRAAEWWYGYGGVEYVLLIKVSATSQMLSYTLYDFAIAPVQGAALPPPVVEQQRIAMRNNNLQAQIQQAYANQQPVNVTFDARRILAIPPNQPLPAGVNDPIVVNLRLMLARMRYACG